MSDFSSKFFIFNFYDNYIVKTLLSYVLVCTLYYVRLYIGLCVCVSLLSFMVYLYTISRLSPIKNLNLNIY